MCHELRKRGTSAADLKFLHRLRQTLFRNFKSKSGTRIICLLVPLLLPKRSEEHTSELQSQSNLVCRLLLEKKKKNILISPSHDTKKINSRTNTIHRTREIPLKVRINRLHTRYNMKL